MEMIVVYYSYKKKKDKKEERGFCIFVFDDLVFYVLGCSYW